MQNLNDLALSVLIVVDSAMYSTMLDHALNELGANVTIEKNGLKAIEIILEKYFDAIIISTSTKDIDGVSLLKALKVIDSPNKKTKIAIMSSRSNLELEGMFKPDLHLIKNSSLNGHIKDTLDKFLNSGHEDKHLDFPFKSVVYIDDSKMLHPLVKMGLRKSKCELHCFTESDEGIEFIIKNKPELVLCDYNLKHGVTGGDVYKKINHYGEKFIFVTGEHAGDLDKLIANNPGVAGVIKKPFSPLDLIKLILSI